MTRAYRAFAFIVDHPRWFLLLLIVPTILAAAQFAKLRVRADLELLVPRGAVYDEFEAVREAFDIHEYALIGLVGSGNVLTPELAVYLDELSGAVQDIDGIETVRSLFTEDNIHSESGGLNLSPFLEDVDAESTALAVEKAQNFSAVQGVLISADLSCVTLLAELARDADKAAVCRALDTLAEERAPPGGLAIHMSGMPIFEGVLGDLIIFDLAIMLPFVTIATALLLFFAYRSWILVVITLIEIVVIDIWTIGLMAFFDVPFHMIHATMPVILMSLAVADEVHVYSRFVECYRGEGSHREHVLQAMANMWRPVFLTSITTSAGFLGFLSMSTVPMQQFGLFTAFGVLGAMVFSLIATPILLDRFGTAPRQAAGIRGLSSMLSALGTGIYRRRRIVRPVAAAVVAASIVGVVQIRTQDSWITNFAPGSEVYVSHDVLLDKLNGMRLLEIEFDSGVENGLFEPEFLRGLAAFRDDLESHRFAGGTVSLADVIEKTHAEYTGESGLPVSPDLVAQYMLILDSSSYANLWDFDYRTTRLTLFCKVGDHVRVSELRGHLEAALAEHMPEVPVRYGGDIAVGYEWTDSMAPNLLRSLATSFVLVFIAVSITMRSLLRGCVVIIPIMVSILFHFGWMGWLDSPLSASRSIFSSVILGVGIDYAIHLYSRYRMSRRKGDSPEAAIGTAFGATGEAIFWNTGVLLVGFGTLFLSSMPPTVQLGLMVVVGVLSSLVATLVMLPLLVTSRSGT